MAKFSVKGVKEAFASTGVNVNTVYEGNEIVFQAAGRTVLKAPIKGVSNLGTSAFIPASRVRSAIAAYTA